MTVPWCSIGYIDIVKKVGPFSVRNTEKASPYILLFELLPPLVFPSLLKNNNVLVMIYIRVGRNLCILIQ